MDLNLESKSVFISGSTSGIGFETARQFLTEGCTVYINGRTADSVSAALDQLMAMQLPGQAKGIAADLGTEEGCRTVFESLSTVDILVNNMGIYTAQSFTKTTDQDWLRLFEVNVLSGVRFTRFFLPKMLGNGWGRIIFVSSECASLVPSDLIAYSTTKAALHALSRGLAQLCSDTHVTVNTVLPGSTMTEGAKQFIQNLVLENGGTFEETEKNFITKNRQNSTLKRFLKPNEVASGILYLCSELASGTNGSVLKIDGGSTGGIGA